MTNSELQNEIEEHGLRIKLLGGFQAFLGPESIQDSAWRLRKARNVVKLLALAEGHRLHREQLLDILWPELEMEAANNNLHKTLYVARRALEPSPSGSGSHLVFQDDSLELTSPGGLWIDTESFEIAAEAARQTKNPEVYRETLDMYEGDLLPEDRYEDWAISGKNG